MNKQLIDSVKDGNRDHVRKLISSGANVNFKDQTGMTPILYASDIGNLEIVNMLIKAGADLNVKNEDGDTALIAAAFNGHNDIMDVLIKAGADITVRNNENYTLLTIAAAYGNAETVNTLINAGIDVNIQQTSTGNTALSFAASEGNNEIVDMLINAGADINIANNDGNTALLSAAYVGSTEVVKLLLKAGADYTIVNKSNQTAYTAARSTEIKTLIKSYMPKKFWKGFTDVDMDKFKTIFETDAPVGAKPPALNYACCPVCLAWVERSEACMYMKHKCPNEIGGFLYHEELYNKFQDEHGFIQWCTICGRICSLHKHYPNSDPHGPKPALIQPTNPAAADPFGDETACLAYGGGGLNEKLSRFRMLRKAALKLQEQVGTLDESDAFNNLVESCWGTAASDSVNLRNANMTAKNFRETPSSAFPAEPRPTTAANNAPAPNVLKPAGLPGTRAVEPDADEMNFMGDEAGDGNPMLEITYEGGYKERVTQDTLKAAIQSRITSHWEPSFGHCLMYPECQARLYPSDIKGFVEDAEYEAYRKRFNEKFAGAVGGRRRPRKSRKSRKVARK